MPFLTKIVIKLKRLNDEEKRIEVIRNVIKTCLDGLNQTSDITELTKNMMTLKETRICDSVWGMMNETKN